MTLPMAVRTLTAIHILAFVAFSSVVKSDRINFYNVRPPVQATPFPNSFKCFTCEQAVDNYKCNRWAEDKWCPQNTQFCMSIHHLSSHGQTKFVTKRCATWEDCRLAGCRHHKDTGHKCVSCCEGMICNIEVPTNHTNAVFTYSSVPSQRTLGARMAVLVLGLSMLVLL